jgi:hypothetical protein
MKGEAFLLGFRSVSSEGAAILPKTRRFPRASALMLSKIA